MDSPYGWIVLAIFAGAAIVRMLRRRGRNSSTPAADPTYAIVDRRPAPGEPYPYIHVNVDGTVRELHASEQKHLETRFHPVDGARPYVKRKYSQKNGWGEIAGFMKRTKVPGRTEILAAPVEDPSKPLARESIIQSLRDKGLEVTENSDGTFTSTKPNR